MRRLLTTSGSPASGCMMFGEAPARLAVLVASLLSVGELLGLVRYHLLSSLKSVSVLTRCGAETDDREDGCKEPVRVPGRDREQPP